MVYGALSTALLASKLYGLSVEQTVHTLGLAGVCNFATRQTRTGQLSDWKACAFANAARNGIFATELARQGMTGPNEIFEGPKGLFKMVTGPFELGWARGPDDWMIRKTYVKFWPAEYHLQHAEAAPGGQRGDRALSAQTLRATLRPWRGCSGWFWRQTTCWRCCRS